MSGRPRRNNTPACKGEKTPAELAQQQDVHANQITQRKTQLLERAASVFGTNHGRPPRGPTSRRCMPRSGRGRWISAAARCIASPVCAADLALMRRIDALHLGFPFAGSRMLRDLLREDGDRGP